jgi:pilus assembly protein Flp/PilA
VQRFLKSEDGPTAVEYAVMLALIVIVCITAIQAIGQNANTTFDGIKTLGVQYWILAFFAALPCSWSCLKKCS